LDVQRGGEKHERVEKLGTQKVQSKEPKGLKNYEIFFSMASKRLKEIHASDGPFVPGRPLAGRASEDADLKKKNRGGTKRCTLTRLEWQAGVR